MSKQYVLNAQTRTEQGKGASRRLRREGLIPAVIYGAGKDAEAITLRHNEVIRNLEEEAFYSQIISIDFGDRKESAILRDLQRHPAKPVAMHVDLQRVKEDEELRVLVPLHYTNEDAAKGVKVQGGKVRHIMSEVEVSCLPKDLPEFITIDMIEVEKGQILHLSDIQLPEGCSIPQLALGEDYNQPIATIA